MPGKPSSFNATNVVFFLPADAPWRERVRSALLGGEDSPEAAKVERHLDLLDQRHAGTLDWSQVLPAPVPRTYADGLLEERHLPLYRHGPLHFSVDLFNPNNEAEDPTYDARFLTVELLVHQKVLYPWGKPGWPEGERFDPSSTAQYARLAERGEALGALAARWAEALVPHFACADIGYLGYFLRTATSPTSVREPAPAGSRHWDYLFSLSYWSPELHTPERSERLQGLRFTEAERARFDSFWGQGIRPTARWLRTGGLFLQHRFIFADFRTLRTVVDTPLARQAGLRTTDLPYLDD